MYAQKATVLLNNCILLVGPKKMGVYIIILCSRQPTAEMTLTNHNKHNSSYTAAFWVVKHRLKVPTE